MPEITCDAIYKPGKKLVDKHVHVPAIQEGKKLYLLSKTLDSTKHIEKYCKKSYLK